MTTIDSQVVDSIKVNKVMVVRGELVSLVFPPRHHGHRLPHALYFHHRGHRDRDAHDDML